MTSDGHEPTRNSSLMSGRRSSSRADDAVELVVGVGEAGEIALLHDGGGEARLGEDHHAGGRLDEMRAGARADHQEERVLDLAVQPDDAGQAAEHLALAALAQHGSIGATPSGQHRRGGGEARSSRALCQRRHVVSRRPLEPRRAQLEQELRGVDHVGGVGGEREQHLLGRRRASR